MPGDKIAYANLNGTGNAHNLSTAPVTPNRPHGVALDPARGKIYWPNYANGADGTISSANLNGSGGGANIPTTGASMYGPELPALLEVPKGTGAPAISGGGEGGATLQCSKGAWAADLSAALLYRAPQNYSFQWTRDGHTVSGATSSSLTASSAGTYRCRVTARNAAGSTTQGSGPHAVSASNDFTFGKLKRNKHKGSAKLTVNVPGPGALTLSDAKKKLKPVSTNPSAAEGVKLPIKPRRKLAKKLGRKGKAKVNASVTFTPTGGSPNTESTKVKLVEKTGH